MTEEQRSDSDEAGPGAGGRAEAGSREPRNTVVVALAPQHVDALIQLCDTVALRGPESKLLIGQAQAALMRSLQQAQGAA